MKKRRRRRKRRRQGWSKRGRKRRRETPLGHVMQGRRGRIFAQHEDFLNGGWKQKNEKECEKIRERVHMRTEEVEEEG